MTDYNIAATAARMQGLHPLLRRLVAETGVSILPDVEAHDAWAAHAGLAMAVYAEDPERYRETLDLAVVVPELHATAGRRFRVGLLLPEAARALAPRYGFARWPAFVMLRDGRYLGAVDGIRDWDVYIGELERLLAAEPARPPSVGIAVRSEGSASSCH
ncbi:MAG: hydrogenase [Burkholderiales bacterium]|nr:hydrogenase [Burkholderiales bacterium]